MLQYYGLLSAVFPIIGGRDYSDMSIGAMAGDANEKGVTAASVRATPKLNRPVVGPDAAWDTEDTAPVGVGV